MAMCLVLTGCPKEDVVYFYNKSGQPVEMKFEGGTASVASGVRIRINIENRTIRVRELREMYNGAVRPVGSIDLFLDNKLVSYPIRSYLIPNSFWDAADNSICYLLDKKFRIEIAKADSIGHCSPYVRQPPQFPQGAEHYAP
jgi:hypothetical protein